jgi:hypothetical protein
MADDLDGHRVELGRYRLRRVHSSCPGRASTIVPRESTLAV